MKCKLCAMTTSTKLSRSSSRKSINKNLNFLINLAMIASDVKPNLDKPQTFNKAWNQTKEKSQRKWWEAICKEFNAWTNSRYDERSIKVLCPSILDALQISGSLKLSTKVWYWVQLVACGYIHVPGIDFSENYLPIIDNITIHNLLLITIHFWYLANKVNFETTFLYMDLEEIIYMECPQGMSDVGKDDCIILNKYIYGLVQTARQYYKKAIKM